MGTFYCLISGSLKFEDYERFALEADWLLQNHEDVCIVTGNEKGADQLAHRYAKERDFGLKIFYADWATLHRDAGKECSRHMYSYIANQDEKGAILFSDGSSSGGLHFKMRLGRELGIPTRVVNV